MIIDVHTHIWPKGFTTENLIQYFKSRGLWDASLSLISAEGLLKEMDKNSIDLSIISSVAIQQGMTNHDLNEVNIYVSRAIKKHPDRLAGFCTVDPFGGSHSIEILKKAIEDLGHIGLKLHPPFQEFYPYDKRCFPIYEKMQEYNMPVLFHSGSIGVLPFKDDFAKPSHIDEVACNFPDLPIIIGHSGKILFDDTAMLMRKHKNIFADISTNLGRNEEFKFMPLVWLLSKIKIWTGSFERVFFGTDYPMYMAKETLTGLNDAANYLNKENKDFVTGEDINKITFLNAQKLFHLIKR
ncbi:MAG: amidohydrolase family protein [Actinomycetota bacterium]